MEGVSIVETKILNSLIEKVTRLESMVCTTLEEIKEAKKPYLTLKEAAQLLNKSEKWVHLNKHEIGCSRTGGDWLFKRKSIEEYINETHFKK